MDYLKHYKELTSSRILLKKERSKLTSRNDHLYELHHILPRSLGGTDEPSNLVWLTYREHFLAHTMLYKIYGGPMVKALYVMMNCKRYKDCNFSSRLYERIKKEYIESVSKPVICLETLEVFPSRTAAAVSVGKSKKCGQDINNAIKLGDDREAGGYHWDNYIEGKDYSKNKWYGKKDEGYLLIRLEDGKKYKSWDEAAKDINLTVGPLGCALKSKGKAGGYHWDYYNQFVDYTKNKWYGKERNLKGCKRKYICEEDNIIFEKILDIEKYTGISKNIIYKKFNNKEQIILNNKHWRKI